MTWSLTFLIIQIVTGMLGGNAAASVVAAQDYRFGGIFAHTVVGALGGALSGLFLQTLAATVVTQTGEVNETPFSEQAFIQVLAGAIAGGAAVFIAGFIKHSYLHHKATQGHKDGGQPQ